MSVNKFRPHVHVLPEDDANRQICNGFLRDPELNGRRIQVLPVAGGWAKVRDDFANIHCYELEKCKERYLVLVVDFDDMDSRLAEMSKVVPEHLRDRVIIIGVKTNPEDLRAELNIGYENIGLQLAESCRSDPSMRAWSHELLAHNAAELERVAPAIRAILFGNV